MARETIERWLTRVLPGDPRLERRAVDAERRVDRKIGARLAEERAATDRPAEADWRRLKHNT